MWAASALCFNRFLSRYGNAQYHIHQRRETRDILMCSRARWQIIFILLIMFTFITKYLFCCYNEPSALMHLYSVNGSSEMFVINVGLIGPSLSSGFLSLSSCEQSSEKEKGDGHIILCVTLPKLAFSGHEMPLYSL